MPVDFSSQLIEFSGNHPILVATFAALLSIILYTEFRNLTSRYGSVGPAAAVPILNQEGTLVIDVREPAEIKTGMIKDALHMPLASFAKRVSELDDYKDKSVLVYCRSGQRSGSACRTLTQHGFEKVYNLSGGIVAWEDQHLPVVKERPSNKSKKKKKS